MATEGFLTLATACKTEAADWKQKLKESGLGYIRFARKNPALFRLMFGGYKFQSASYREAAQAALEGLKDIIAQSGTDQPQARLLSAWGVVHGLSHILIDGLYANPVDEAQLTKAIGRWAGTTSTAGIYRHAMEAVNVACVNIQVDIRLGEAWLRDMPRCQNAAPHTGLAAVGTPSFSTIVSTIDPGASRIRDRMGSPI